MKGLLVKKTIFWDFDGVLLDSSQVREKGFRDVLAEYPEEQVEQLIQYHRINGGLSRYHKFRYFFQKIRGRDPQEKEVNRLASQFSSIMKVHLTDPKRLIEDSLGFLTKYYDQMDMHLVSGSDKEELKYLAKELDIDPYFKSIEGSPTPKNLLVRNILLEYDYERSAVALIGDSINDFDAARENQIDFFGYNNMKLCSLGAGYIKSFDRDGHK